MNLEEQLRQIAAKGAESHAGYRCNGAYMRGAESLIPALAQAMEALEKYEHVPLLERPGQVFSGATMVSSEALTTIKRLIFPTNERGVGEAHS